MDLKGGIGPDGGTVLYSVQLGQCELIWSLVGNTSNLTNTASLQIAIRVLNFQSR